jgi:hypothetical protein
MDDVHRATRLHYARDVELHARVSSAVEAGSAVSNRGRSELIGYHLCPLLGRKLAIQTDLTALTMLYGTSSMNGLSH